jgi:hypothetical protein
MGRTPGDVILYDSYRDYLALVNFRIKKGWIFLCHRDVIEISQIAVMKFVG